MYVIAGVTGHTGRAAAETLISHGEKVRVVVRDAKQGEPWKQRGAEVAVASLADTAALVTALAGAKGVYLLVPPRYDADDLLAAHRGLVEAMAQAVRKSGVPHVTALSSMGAELAEGTGPIRSLHHMEAALGKAAKNITFIRPGYFFENFAPLLSAVQGGTLPTFLTAGRAIPMAATADVGRVAAEMLLEPANGTRLVELGTAGGRSPEDVARELATIVGREVAVQAGPLDGIVPTFTSMGMSRGVAELFREMIGAINSGRVKHQGSPAVQRFGQLGPADVLRPLFAGAPSHA